MSKLTEEEKLRMRREGLGAMYEFIQLNGREPNREEAMALLCPITESFFVRAGFEPSLSKNISSLLVDSSIDKLFE